jgi:biofilm PGA synthesis N-glycosyltransferase PgaC
VYNWAEHIEQIELVLFVIFCVFFCIQVVYYLKVYYPVLRYNSPTNRKAEPISVIICARNEAENLQKNLPAILEQNYPGFEVIVVNDCSTDDSDEVLGLYLKKYKNLKTTNLPAGQKFSHGKKLAITVGIKAATYNNLVFTDADCCPESKNWLLNMQCGFTNHEIVLGYGGYKREKSFINNYIRYDTVTIALQYMGFALAKNPYMGVGRNLAYKKELFFKNKGFANHYGLLSGDDDLFINEVSTKENTTLVIEKEAYTRSEAKKTFGGFLEQKMRHLTTASKYRRQHIFFLGLEPLSRVWFYALLVILLTMPKLWIPAVAMAGARFLIQLFLYIKAGTKFEEKNIWFSFIIFDLLSLFFNFIAYLTLSIRGRKIRWK